MYITMTVIFLCCTTTVVRRRSQYHKNGYLFLMRPSNKSLVLPDTIIIKLEGKEKNFLLKIDYILHSGAIEHWRNIT